MIKQKMELTTTIPQFEDVFSSLLRGFLIPALLLPITLVLLYAVSFRKITIVDASVIFFLYGLSIFVVYGIGMVNYHSLGGDQIPFQQFCGVLPYIKIDMCNETWISLIAPVMNSVCDTLKCPNCADVRGITCYDL